MKVIERISTQVVPIFDFAFFFTQEIQTEKCDNDQIAAMIKGASYTRTQQRLSEFVDRCNATVNDLQARVDETNADFTAAVARVAASEPGNPPSKWFNKNDPNAIDRYNRAVDKYNNQIELHRRHIDQANRAKERYEDATGKLQDKMAELEEQIRIKQEELQPALDNDILTFIGKMQQLAYDNLHNKRNLFAGFLLAYLTKKTYVFLYDYIADAKEQRAATDIFKKLADELDAILHSSPQVIREGITNTIVFLFSCYKTNAEAAGRIEDWLADMPYASCSEAEGEIRQLLSFAATVNLQYRHLIDPVALARVEAEARRIKEQCEQQVHAIDSCMETNRPLFKDITATKAEIDRVFLQMNDFKSGTFDPVSTDVLFTLKLFDGHDLDRYLMKHKQWMLNLQQEIENTFGISIAVLMEQAFYNELQTRSTGEKLQANTALQFLQYEQQLPDKKDQLLQAIRQLENMLVDMQALPKKHAEVFARKASLWRLLSLLPLASLGLLFPFLALFRKFMPALSSQHPVFVELRKQQAKESQFIAYIQGALSLTSGVTAIFATAALQATLLVCAIGYIVPATAHWFKGRQLQRLDFPVMQSAMPA